MALLFAIMITSKMHIQCMQSTIPYLIPKVHVGSMNYQQLNYFQVVFIYSIMTGSPGDL